MLTHLQPIHPTSTQRTNYPIQTLNSTPPLPARRLADTFNTIVRQRLATAFKEQTGKVPPSLRKDKMIAATGMGARLLELSKAGLEFTLAAASLSTFRTQMQAAVTQGSSQGGSTPTLPEGEKRKTGVKAWSP